MESKLRQRLPYIYSGFVGLVSSVIVWLFWKSFETFTHETPFVSSIRIVGQYSWELPIKLNRSFDSILGVLFALAILLVFKLRSEQLVFGFSIGILSGFFNGVYSGLIYNIGGSLILSLFLGTLVQLAVFCLVFFLTPGYVAESDGLAYIGGVCLILIIMVGLLSGLPVGMAASLISVIFSIILMLTTVGIICLVQRFLKA